MATPAVLTQRYRRALGISAEASRREIARLVRSASIADIDAWWARQGPKVVDMVADGFDVTAALASRYLIAHAETASVSIEPVAVAVDLDQVATSLRVSGPVAFKTNIRRTADPGSARRVMTQSLTGSARRLILAGARDATRATVDAEPRILGYRRVTSSSPCAFCAMLASRGAVYKSEASAGAGDRYHDSCSCTQEPVYRRDRDERPPFQAEWQEAKSLARSEGVRVDVAFRRLLEQRQ